MNITSTYIEREIDAKLWTVCREWLESRNAIQWISLVSSPGRGNTTLLKHFCARAEADKASLGQNRIIFVPAADSLAEQVPDLQDPIARSIFELYVHSVQRWQTQLVAQLARYRALSRLRNVGLVFASILFIVLLHEKPFPLHFFSRSWWRNVAEGFEPNQLLIELTLAVVGALVLEVFKPHEQKEEPKTKRRGLDPESFCNSSPNLFSAIARLCRGHWGLVLVVDNAYALPPEGKQFLFDLCHPAPSREEILRLRKSERVLVITLDLENSKWDFPSEFNRNFRKLPEAGPFRHFTRIELQDIFRTNEHSLPENELDWVLDLAEQNVKALFFNDALEIQKKIVSEYEQARTNGLRGVFGHCELMAYWSVTRDAVLQKSELLAWVKNLDSEHLALFHLEAPQQYQTLTTDFLRSSMVRSSYDTISFDPVARRGLRKWLEETAEEKETLLQAHSYWQRSLLKSVNVNSEGIAKRLSAGESSAIKQAAWHAIKERDVLQEMDRGKTDTTLTAAQQMQLTQEFAFLFVKAAGLWNADGDLETSNNLIHEALNCYESCDAGAESILLLASRCLWSNFWLSADAQPREKLEQLGQKYPDIAQLPHWVVQRQFDQFLQGPPELGSLELELETEAETPDHPDLINIVRLTQTLRAIREVHGFASEGLRDRSLLIPEPLPWREEPWAEYALWDLRAAAFNRREQWEGLESVLQAWHKRLSEDGKPGSPLGMQAYHEFHYARYWHLLLECWKLRSADTRDLEEGARAQSLGDLQDWLLPYCPRPPVSCEFHEHLFHSARTHYQRALQIAALLGLLTLMLEAGFQFGDLLLRFTSAEDKEKHPFWWKEWSRLFEGCLIIERRCGWNIHAPDIHRLSWNFFQEKDRTTSVSDAYNVLESAKRCGYPATIILQWHEKVSSLLTNYGDSKEDRKRSATLHEMWAEQLAQLEAAGSHRHFRNSLLLERARSLQFASQDERLVEDFLRAEQLLDRADALYREALASEHGEDPDEVRDLGIGLRMQRAWLSADRRDTAEEKRRLIWDLWHDLWPECQHNANVLGTLVGLEEREKILDESWPPTGYEMYMDPDNLSLSLPEKWFYPLMAIHPQNRFEFRFYQLVHLVSRRPNPTYAELAFLSAALHWNGQEHFGETVIGFAEIDVNRQYSRNCRPLCITLLEAVAFDFHNRKNEEKEMTSYRLLMKYAPETDSYRVKYIEVLVTYKELLERELRVLGFERTDWFGTAGRLDYYFSVLVDEDLLQSKLSDRIGRKRETWEQFQAFNRRLQDKLVRARTHWRDSQHALCLQELEGVFHFQQDWVSLAFLEALDLWLKCASIVPQAADIISKRAALLRRLAMQYIAQIAATVRESQAQQLAIELMQALEKPQTTSLSSVAAAS